MHPVDAGLLQSQVSVARQALVFELEQYFSHLHRAVENRAVLSEYPVDAEAQFGNVKAEAVRQWAGFSDEAVRRFAIGGGYSMGDDQLQQFLDSVRSAVSADWGSIAFEQCDPSGIRRLRE